MAEDSGRIDEVVEVMQECMHDPNPESAVDLILAGDTSTQLDTAAGIPATPTATAPLHRASTQVGM